MIKQTITYTDYDGSEKAEDRYFKMSKTLATENEIHEVEDKIRDTGFYNPDLWKTRYLGKWICPTRVEFDEAEEAMIRQLANKFGYPKEDIVRTAVRDMFVHYIVSEVVE